MKKIFLMLVMLLSVFSLTAQIKISSGNMYKCDAKQLMIIQMAYSWVYEYTVNEEIVSYSINLNTDNRFDDWTSLDLGDTKEKAVNSINLLLELINNETDAHYVDNISKKEITLTYRNELGVKQLWISQQGNAGISWITKKQLEKVLKYFEKK